MTEINEEIEIIHPIYGKYIANKFYDLKYYNYENKEFITIIGYKIYISNNSLEPMYVHSGKTGKKLALTNNMSVNIDGKNLKIFNFALSSVFYEYFKDNEIFTNITDMCIDHIDDNHYNNLLNNLQFLSISQNAKKAIKKYKEIIEENEGRNGINIMLTNYDKKNKKHLNDIKAFKSISELAQYVIDNNFSTDKATHRKVSSIFGEIINDKRLSYNNGKLSAYKIVNEIDDEIWKNIPKELYSIQSDKYYQVSNKGRVKNLAGEIMRHTKHRYAKYTHVSLNNEHYYIHHLVYVSFHPENIHKINFKYNKKNKTKEEIDKLFIVGHNDNAPLYKNDNDEPYYRNFLEDLYLTNYSENTTHYHENKSITNDIIQDNSYINIDNINSKNENAIIPKMEKTEYQKNSIEFLMTNRPPHIQYNQPKRRSTYYVLSKKLTKDKDIKSSGSKLYSDKEKFIQILYIYTKFVENPSFNFEELKQQLNESEVENVNKLISDYDEK